MLRPSIASLLIALSFTVGAASAQSVLVVDDEPGPGVDFTSPDAAIAAAGEGDAILVRAGVYAGDVTVDAKSLAIAADPQGAAVQLLGRLSVQHLSSAQFVSVAGLHVDSADESLAASVEDNLGHVWFEDCVIAGLDAEAIGDPSGMGLDITNSAHVTLVRCDVSGGTGKPYLAGNPFTGHGAIAMRVTSSGVRLFDTHVTGGANHCNPFQGCSPFPSATGLAAISGTVLLEGSELRAGDPGFWFPTGEPPLATGDAGAALLLYGGPTVTAFDTTYPVGSPAIEIVLGTLTTLPGSSRDFTITSPVRTGELHTLEFTGVAGEQVWVFAGLEPAGIPAPKFKGALLVQQPSLLLGLGVLPASGELALTSPAAAFPAALDSLQVALQAAFAGGGGAILSDPARIVLLQPAF